MILFGFKHFQQQLLCIFLVKILEGEGVGKVEIVVLILNPIDSFFYKVALKMAIENNIYYVNFRQRLHEIIKVRLGRNIGPGTAYSVPNKDR